MKFRRLVTFGWLVLATAQAVPADENESVRKLTESPGLFKSITNPPCSYCNVQHKKGFIEPNDRVVAWLRGNHNGGAIPLRHFLSDSRVINDTYGIFFYDPDGGYVSAFEPSRGYKHTYEFHGWRNGVMVVKANDGSLVSALSGEVFAGPRKGELLKRIPNMVTDWQQWLMLHPDSVAYRMFDGNRYAPAPLPTELSQQARESMGDVDVRLKASASVIGVTYGGKTKAYPLGGADDREVFIDSLGSQPIAVFWYGPTKTAVAFSSSLGDQTLTFVVNEGPGAAPITDRETLSHWTLAGRAVEGKLRGRELKWVDSVQCNWQAWSSEYPNTELYTHQTPKKKTVAGKADVLKNVPKNFATVVKVDASMRKVHLLVEGEESPRAWPVNVDAEIKIHGWWGRLQQFNAGDRVWVWFDINRQKQPISVLMLADEVSEQDIHSAAKRDDIELLRNKQRDYLRDVWRKRGLPGAVTVLHKLGGEMDVLLDHEAIRWGRHLKNGDQVTLQTETPINAAVKEVRPWRERTLIRLVTASGLDQADLSLGQRVRLLVAEPPPEVQDSDSPTDIGRERSKDQRIEWFLASIYCTCKIGGDKCTGMFYTLASCSSNGCPNPNKTRRLLAGLVDEGKSDGEILDQLREARGPELLKPHLLK